MLEQILSQAFWTPGPSATLLGIASWRSLRSASTKQGPSKQKMPGCESLPVLSNRKQTWTWCSIFEPPPIFRDAFKQTRGEEIGRAWRRLSFCIILVPETTNRNVRTFKIPLKETLQSYFRDALRFAKKIACANCHPQALYHTSFSLHLRPMPGHIFVAKRSAGTAKPTPTGDSWKNNQE